MTTYFYPGTAEAEAEASSSAISAPPPLETNEAQVPAQAQTQSQSQTHSRSHSQAQAQAQAQVQTQAAAQTHNAGDNSNDNNRNLPALPLPVNVNVEAFYRNQELPAEQPWLAPTSTTPAPVSHDGRAAYQHQHEHQHQHQHQQQNVAAEWNHSYHHLHYHHHQQPVPQPPPHTRYPSSYVADWQPATSTPVSTATTALPIRERQTAISFPATPTPGVQPILLSGISRVPRTHPGPAGSSSISSSTSLYPQLPTASTSLTPSTTQDSFRLPLPQLSANTSPSLGSQFNPTLQPEVSSSFHSSFNPFSVYNEQSNVPLTPVEPATTPITTTTAATSNPPPGPLLAPAPAPASSTQPSADCASTSGLRQPRQYRSVKPLRKPGMYPRPANNKRVADASTDNDADANSVGGGGGGAASGYSEYEGRAKVARTDPMSFSTVVKGRQMQHTRTGQACDRCKVRKIRCDAAPDGCSHCVTINAECLVTDRVSGRTEKRGYLKELEREKEAMLVFLQDVEALLREKGILVKPWKNSTWADHHPETHPDDNDNPIPMTTPPRDPNWKRWGSLWIREDPTSVSSYDNSPVFNFSRPDLESRPQEQHIGVGEDKAPINSIRGTVLSVLGMTINTAAFAAPDIDEPPENAEIPAHLYNKSLQSFLQSSMKNSNVEVSLPSREDAFTWAGWYFGAVSIFIPLIHKPTFMRLLTRIYDEQGFRPSIPELVIVHMIFATILFQYGARNSQDTEGRRRWNDMSNKHYHFAISKMYDLLGSRDFISVQALAMIACHTRSFPKPSCVSLVSNLALQRAIDLNLHRSSRKPGQGTNLENEMRKRTWWVILMIVVAVTGRRGSPIPITVEEFDTEFPEPIADELLTDEGVDPTSTMPCPFWAGLAGIKITPIFMQMYSNIYSVRREPANYSRIVRSLERQLGEWKAALPESLKLPDMSNLDQSPVPAIYIKTFELELRLCLRHPYVAMTGDQKMIDENYQISVQSAQDYLKCVQRLSKLKSLDTTWYQMSIYAACIFSTLVASWVKRFKITPEEITALEEEMRSWKAILQETGILMGAGPGISTEIEGVIAHTINRIDADMRSARGRPPTMQEDSQQSQTYQVAQRIPTNTRPESSRYFQELAMNPQSSYPPVPGAYGSQSSGPSSAYQTDAPIFYNTTQQGSSAAVDAIAGGSAAAPMTAYGAQAAPLPSSNMWSDRQNSWQEWTTVITHDQNRYGTGPLMDMQRVPGHTQALTDTSGATGDMSAVLHPTAQASWPHLVFDGATSNT